jgi:hypothetical protein
MASCHSQKDTSSNWRKKRSMRCASLAVARRSTTGVEHSTPSIGVI